MAKLRFSGKEIGHHNLLLALKSAPDITVQSHELHTGEDYAVEYHPRPYETTTDPVVFYKVDTKYIVILGNAKIPPELKYIRGKLLTSQMIKRIQTMDMPALPTQALLQPRENFDDRQRPPYQRRDGGFTDNTQFRNSPRFRDR